MNDAPATGQKPRARLQFSVERLGNESVVLNADNGVAHHLNETASLVWHACDGSHTIDDVAEELVTRFDIDLETARRDVATVVTQLRELGLIDPDTSS